MLLREEWRRVSMSAKQLVLKSNLQRNSEELVAHLSSSGLG